MADGTISIDVELNEKAFRSSLENMGGIVSAGSEQMIKSIGNLSGSFVLLPDTVKSVVGAIPDIIGGVINHITGKNPVMTQAGTEFFSSFIGEMPDIMGKISDSAEKISDTVRNRFTDFMPGMSETGSGFFTSLIANMPDIIKNITGAAPEITEKTAEAITDGESLISQAGFDLFCSLTKPMPEVAKELAKAPDEIMSMLAGRFHGQTEQFKSVGENIVYGVWSGISSLASWLSKSVTGFFSGILGSVTSFLGISSPSRLFRDLVGRNIALGVKAGIDGEMPGVVGGVKAHMSRLTNAAAESARFDYGAADVIGRSNAADNSELRDIMRSRFEKENAGMNAITPEINVTLEPSGDIRGFFDYISMGIKRSDYLNG